MRRRLPTLLLCILLFSLLAGCGEDVATMQSPTMARVGDTNITVAQYSTDLNREAQPYIEGTGSTPEQARQFFYDRLIQEEIFLNEARRAGFGIDAELAAEVDGIIARATTPSGKGVTFKDYQALADTYKFGSVDAIRTYLSRQVILDAYVRTVQVDGVPQKVNLRLIALNIPEETEAASAEVKKQADEIVAQLRAGATFATLAQTYSAEQESAAAGGELGLRDLNELPPELKQALDGLPTDQISDPIQMPGVWYIFEITDRVTFPTWQELLQSSDGQAFVAQKVAEYSANGEFLPYIQVENLPLPNTIQQ